MTLAGGELVVKSLFFCVHLVVRDLLICEEVCVAVYSYTNPFLDKHSIVWRKEGSINVQTLDFALAPLNCAKKR